MYGRGDSGYGVGMPGKTAISGVLGRQKWGKIGMAMVAAGRRWLGAAFWHLSATTRAARRTLVWWHSIQRAHQTRTRTTTRVPLQLPPFVPSSHRSPCPDEPYEGHADPRALAFVFRMRGKMGATSCGTAKKKCVIVLTIVKKQNYFLFTFSYIFSLKKKSNQYIF